MPVAKMKTVVNVVQIIFAAVKQVKIMNVASMRTVHVVKIQTAVNATQNQIANVRLLTVVTVAKIRNTMKMIVPYHASQYNLVIVLI